MIDYDKLHDVKVRLAEKLADSYAHKTRKVRNLLKSEDARLNDYVKEVAKHPERHNVFEIAGVLKWMYLVGKYEYDQAEVRRFIRFKELCKHTSNSGPRCFKVTPVQYFVFSTIYGLKVAEHTETIRINGVKTKRVVPAHRLIREAILYVARKYSKTSDAAAMSAYDVITGPSDAEVYICSNSADQSDICFRECSAVMSGWFPHLMKVRDKEKKLNQKVIVFNDSASGRRSFIKCMSNSPSKADGFKGSTLVLDEYSQSVDTATKRGDAMKNVITTSMGTRLEPLTIVITTASDKLDGPFHAVDLPSYMARLIDDEEWNDTVFPFLFMAEPWEGDNPADEVSWMKAQPHYGVTVQPEFYRNQWAEAQKSPSLMVDFMTKLLNVPFRGAQGVWMPSQIIDRARIKFDPMTFMYHPSFGDVDVKMAVDLSIDGDFSCVGTAIDLPGIHQTWINCKYFVPDGIRIWQATASEARANGWSVFRDYGNGVVLCEDHPLVRTPEHPNGVIESTHENRFLYQRWVDDGHLTLTHGEKIDYEQIADYSWEIIQRVSPSELAYDQYRSIDYINRLAALQGSSAGLHPYSQMYSAFTGAVQWFDQSIRRGALMIDENPINAYCIGNCTLDYSADGCNCKPVKMDSRRRIDGAIVMLMCLGQFAMIGHRTKSNDFED